MRCVPGHRVTAAICAPRGRCRRAWIAEVKGLVQPDQKDFSLAELYCGVCGSPVLSADRHMGFAQ